MNVEPLGEIVVRFDMNMAREDCAAQIKKIVETLGVALKNLDALTVDNVETVEQYLLTASYNAKFIADLLSKERAE